MNADDGPLDFDAGHDARPRPPDPVQPAAPPPVAGNRYGWFVGLAAVVAIVLVAVAGPRDAGPGASGLTPGTPLPPFAVPLAGADLSCDRPEDRCDANVATRRGQQDAGARPACEVRGPRILNVCALAERGPLVLAFLANTGGDCAGTLDPLQAVARRHPGVQVAVVGIGGDLANLRATVAEHRWSFPVGWDRDGILASLYGVAACPYVTYARWRGGVLSTAVGDLDRRDMDRRIEAAVAASTRAGWSPPPSG